MFYLGSNYGEASVEKSWAAEKLTALQAQAAQIKLAGERTGALRAELSRLTIEKNNENTRLTARYESIIAGLRERPAERASGDSGLPSVTTPGAGCTGAGLARPDAEFLAGYAADAARLQLALASCTGAYEAARLSPR
jgi:hypothetical protein